MTGCPLYCWTTGKRSHSSSKLAENLAQNVNKQTNKLCVQTWQWKSFLLDVDFFFTVKGTEADLPHYLDVSSVKLLYINWLALTQEI